MIPIYFDDPSLGPDDLNRVSQMFISDKAGQYRNERELGFITRKHDSIQCISDLPFIALLLDLNVQPTFNVSFPEMEPKHAETDRCLRIYAAGVSDTTFPFLHEHSKLANLLRGLVSREQQGPSRSALKHLDDLAKFGSTVRLCHMQWETPSVSVSEEEVPCSLKRPAQSEASSTPKHVALVISHICSH